MQALDSFNIRHVEFIRLTMPSATYTFCNAAAPVTVGGITFSNLGSLLMLGDVQQDIKATSNDLTISLNGIDPANIIIVLGSQIKGSGVEVWRGFLDDYNQILVLGGVTQFFKRYTGIVTNISLTEDWNGELRTRVATCGLSCASMRIVLNNRIAGTRTNQQAWQFVYPSDTSMNRVAEITNQYFDFGAPPMTGGVADPGGGGPVDSQGNMYSEPG
jgi:hypothetical protein